MPLDIFFFYFASNWEIQKHLKTTTTTQKHLEYHLFNIITTVSTIIGITKFYQAFTRSWSTDVLLVLPSTNKTSLIILTTWWKHAFAFLLLSFVYRYIKCICLWVGKMYHERDCVWEICHVCVVSFWVRHVRAIVLLVTRLFHSCNHSSYDQQQKQPLLEMMLLLSVILIFASLT